MEYTPKYPQPFSFHQAIALDPAVAWDEIARLQHSLQHLKRTQSELQEYLRELAPEEQDLEVSQAAKENEITIASQDERIFMLKLALTHHGYSTASTAQTSTSSPPSDAPSSRAQNTFVSDSNGLDDSSPIDHTPPVNPESSDVQEQERGMYL